MSADTQQTSPFTVADWRFQQLRRAGWPEPDALLLAERPDVDLHLACELLERGCDAATTRQILR